MNSDTTHPLLVV